MMRKRRGGLQRREGGGGGRRGSRGGRGGQGGLRTMHGRGPLHAAEPVDLGALEADVGSWAGWKALKARSIPRPVIARSAGEGKGSSAAPGVEVVKLSMHS